MSIDRGRNFLLIVALLGILFVSIALSYSNVVRGEFQFDDGKIVAEDGRFLMDPFKILKRGVFHALVSGRVITAFTFYMNYQIGGSNVEGYHVTNIFLHLLVVLVIYLFALKLFRDGGLDAARWYALFVSGLFGLHPLQTEAVSYIVQRAEIMASIFYLLSLMAFLKYSESEGRLRWLWWVAGIIGFVFGWGSKQIVITIPIMYLLYVWTFQGRRERKRAFMGMIPVFLIGGVAGVYLLMGFSGSSHVGFDIKGLSATEYFYTQTRVILTYLRLIFLPLRQNLDYDYPIYRSLTDSTVLLSLFLNLMIIGLSISLLLRRGWEKVVGYGIIWFYVLLVPTSTVIPLKDVIMEHRLYLAVFGVIVATITVVAAMVRRGWIKAEVAVIAYLIVLTLLAFLTHERNRVWQSKLALWEDVVRKSPGKARPHNNLGKVLLDKARFREAISEFEKSLKLDPSHESAYNNLGLALMRLGKIDRASYYFKKAMGLDFNYPDPHINLGTIYFMQRDLDRALSEFLIALRLSPRNPGIYNNLGIVYAERREFGKAFRYLQEAIRLNSAYFDAWNNLGKVYMNAGMFEEAAAAFQSALSIRPFVPEVIYNTAIAYLRLGKRKEALMNYQSLQRINPSMADKLREELSRNGPID